MEFTIKLHKKPRGVFVFIDDDEDEHELFGIAMKQADLSNDIIHCYNGQEAYQYLMSSSEEIFAIICDVNMPKVDGLELKRMIEMTPELKTKSIPFIFHSSTGTVAEVKTAYSLNIQGYLQKANDIEGTVSSIRRVIAMWTDVIHPKDIH